jgi:hypothetical protein
MPDRVFVTGGIIYEDVLPETTGIREDKTKKP